MLIETRTAGDPELAVLLTAQQNELSEAGPGSFHRALDAAVYVVAVEDGRAVGCGGWQPLPDGSAELKRMYVRPAYRGRGIARQLVVTLEEMALQAGHAVIRIETAPYLLAALRLYRSAGYAPIEPFGEYVGDPDSVCFERRLPLLLAP